MSGGSTTDIRSYRRQATDAAKLKAKRERPRSQGTWPAQCLESERRFNHRGARLYPLFDIENGVRTPQGIGTLLQVIAGEARVLLMRTRATAEDLQGKRYRPSTSFPIEDVEPYTRGD